MIDTWIDVKDKLTECRDCMCKTHKYNGQDCSCPFSCWVEDEFTGKSQWICRLSNDIAILNRGIVNLQRE